MLRSCLARPTQAAGSRRHFSTRSASSATPVISPEMCACWATGLEQSVTVRSIHQDDGQVFYRVTEAALLTLRVVPNPRVAQFARIADTSFRIYVVQAG